MIHFHQIPVSLRPPPGFQLLSELMRKYKGAQVNHSTLGEVYSDIKRLELQDQEEGQTTPDRNAAKDALKRLAFEIERALGIQAKPPKDLAEIVAEEMTLNRSLEEVSRAVAVRLPHGFRVGVVRSVLYAGQLHAMMNSRRPILRVPVKRFFVIVEFDGGREVVPVVIK